MAIAYTFKKGKVSKHNTYKNGKKDLITLRDVGLNYLSEHPEETLSYHEVYALLILFFKKLSVAIIEEKYHFRMGMLGKIRIAKFKAKKGKNIDFNETRKLGKIVYHLNRHTDGFSFRFIWKKMRNIKRVTNGRYYKFTPTRGLSLSGVNLKIGKRGLAAYIKKCSEDPTMKDYDCLTSAVSVE